MSDAEGQGSKPGGGSPADASRRWTPIVAAAGAAMLVAGLGATITDLGPWYLALKQPAWKPHDMWFGPAWTVIFALAAMSAVTAWRAAPDGRARDLVIGLYATNGFLNILWSFLFFRMQRPDWALIEVAFLWLSILVPILVFGRHSRSAALLMVPYLAWVTFAAWLNWAVVDLNGPF